MTNIIGYIKTIKDGGCGLRITENTTYGDIRSAYDNRGNNEIIRNAQKEIRSAVANYLGSEKLSKQDIERRKKRIMQALGKIVGNSQTKDLS